MLGFSPGRSCSRRRRLASKLTPVPPGTEIKCSRVHFSLTGSPSSSSLKPAHLTSNLKAVRGQLGADCHGDHVRHKTLLLCFQCDIPPPLPLKGSAFHQSSGADWWKPLLIHRQASQRDASPAVRSPLNSHVEPDGFRRSPARICLCRRVESLEDKALGINRSSLGFTPVSPRNAQDLSSIQFYEYLISPCVCAPLKCACVCTPHLRVCHLKYTQ